MPGFGLSTLLSPTEKSRITKFLDEERLYDFFPTEPTAKRLCFHQRCHYLRVLDLEFDGHESTTRAETLRHDTIYSSFRRRSSDEFRVDIGNALSCLPARTKGGIRIYLAQDLYPTLLDLHSEEADAIRWSSDVEGRKGYHGLSAQWRAPVPEAYFESTAFLLDSDIAEDQPGLMNTTKKVYISEQSDGGLIMLISSETYKSTGFFGMRDITDEDTEAAMIALRSVKQFAIDFGQLQDLYKPLLWEAKTCTRRKQILLLWFNHVQLFQTLHHFEKVRMMYQGLIELRRGSRRSQLGLILLDEFITESNLFEKVEVMAEDFTCTLEALIDIIKAGSEDKERNSQGFNIIATDLRGLASDLRRKAGDMPRLAANHLKFLEMRRSTEGSKDLYLLSVIASIFLPLSLACSVLSMQTRLKDLHYLLYDFCGIVVLVLTFVDFYSGLAKFFTFLAEHIPENIFHRAELGKGSEKLIHMAKASAWAVILVSFIVGMAKNVRLGGLILGYGMAAVIGIGAIVYAVAFVRFVLVLRKEQLEA